MPDLPVENHFFVDEAGDLTLLGRRGKSLMGTQGVSCCFMVGVAHVADLEALSGALASLRQDLLRDPYLAAIPSMQPDEGKTAHAFHAKDDCPEVRMAVFKVLAAHDIKVQVGVRRKSALVELARDARARGTRLDPHAVYDDLVKTLFETALHTAPRSTIRFARRGKSDRQEALEHAIAAAQRSFQRYTGITGGQAQVIPSVPSESAGLQAIDYCLWALQRFYERGEDRYFNFLRARYRLIMDLDNPPSDKGWGTWYDDKNPLTPEKIKSATD